jgi:hypothetical protein
MQMNCCWPVRTVGITSQWSECITEQIIWNCFKYYDVNGGLRHTVHKYRFNYDDVPSRGLSSPGSVLLLVTCLLQCFWTDVLQRSTTLHHCAYSRVSCSPAFGCNTLPSILKLVNCPYFSVSQPTYCNAQQHFTTVLTVASLVHLILAATLFPRYWSLWIAQTSVFPNRRIATLNNTSTLCLQSRLLFTCFWLQHSSLDTEAWELPKLQCFWTDVLQRSTTLHHCAYSRVSCSPAFGCNTLPSILRLASENICYVYKLYIATARENAVT